jgi:hypothetical protein
LFKEVTHLQLKKEQEIKEKVEAQEHAKLSDIQLSIIKEKYEREAKDFVVMKNERGALIASKNEAEAKIQTLTELTKEAEKIATTAIKSENIIIDQLRVEKLAVKQMEEAAGKLESAKVDLERERVIQVNKTSEMQKMIANLMRFPDLSMERDFHLNSI